METFGADFGLLTVISFLCVLFFILLLLKIFSWHIHGLIVLVCAVLVSAVFLGKDLWPFRTIGHAFALLTMLSAVYLIIQFKKRR